MSPVQTDAGHGTSTVVSRVLTEYDACACSPLGKVKRASRPHLPGQVPVYTEYEYDAMGRTVNVKQPPNSGTTGSSGDTKYIYAGNSVSVTDPKGDYKRYYYDAFGNLVWAVDPKPGGGEYGTGYKYDLLNRLREVSMTRDGVTQIRKFEYNAQQRLEKVTTPESGTTTYTYNPDGTLLRKTWANGGKVEYGYDTWKRVNAVNRFMPGSVESERFHVPDESALPVAHGCERLR